MEGGGIHCRCGVWYPKNRRCVSVDAVTMSLWRMSRAQPSGKRMSKVSTVPIQKPQIDIVSDAHWVSSWSTAECERNGVTSCHAVSYFLKENIILLFIKDTLNMSKVTVTYIYNVTKGIHLKKCSSFDFSIQTFWKYHSLHKNMEQHNCFQHWY